MNQLILYKGSQSFIFRYKKGDETAVFAAAMEKAIAGENGFDLTDAAFVAFKIGIITPIQLATCCLPIC